MRKSFLIALSVCVLFLSSLALFAGPSGYHVTKKTVLGGDGSWDYLTADSQTRRVYISRSTHVMVVDADSAAIVGDIPNTPGVHGIALAPEMNKGFTSNGRENTVTIFDLKTLKELGRVPVGKGPDAIIYDPASKRVFTMNGGSQDATALDAKTGTVAGTIPLGGKPEFAASDEKGHVYINIEDKNEIVAVDSNKLSVNAHWPLGEGKSPSGLAIDAKHHRLFAGCGDNQLMVVMNADNGTVVASLPIGKGVDACGFDPGTGYAFSSNGEGTLTVIHEDSPDKFSVVENVPTQVRARTMALDTKTHNVFVVTAEYGPAPAPSPGQQRPPRAPMVPGSFTLLTVSR
jgi:YVTN family beta-propeller protein